MNRFRDDLAKAIWERRWLVLYCGHDLCILEIPMLLHCILDDSRLTIVFWMTLGWHLEIPMVLRCILNDSRLSIVFWITLDP
jgi:hypothetical protein